MDFTDPEILKNHLESQGNLIPNISFAGRLPPDDVAGVYPKGYFAIYGAGNTITGQLMKELPTYVALKSQFNNSAPGPDLTNTGGGLNITFNNNPKMTS